MATGLSLVLLLALRGDGVQASNITVTVTNDELNTDGDCSLREAVQAANTDTAVDGCVAGAGPDTILLPAGTYALSITNAAPAGENANLSGDLDLNSVLTISGAGAGATVIDGGQIDRVFHLLQASEATISGLTIRNGLSTNGGGILASTATLSLESVTVSDNRADTGGGISSSATGFTFSGVTVTGNTATGVFSGGGGIFNSTASGIISNST
ncbi:MAG: CSLREA domain-containing protein, partial [Gammaproteobacteria bacterium]